MNFHEVTEKEALADLFDAKEAWFELNIELGRTIPVSIKKSTDISPVKTTIV